MDFTTYPPSDSTPFLHAIPAVVTSRATLEALDHINHRSIPLLWYPRVGKAATNEPVKLLWAWPEYAFAPECCDSDIGNVPTTSSPAHKAGYQGKRHDSAHPPSPSMEDMPLTFRVQDDGSTASRIQDASLRTTSSSPPAQTAPTTSRVHDRSEGKQALGRALVSVHDRRPEAWREGMDDMAERGECIETLFSILSLGLQAEGSRDV
ncbi:hypothetical protein BU25DRAFT_454504 [Macroventuria anomochaeta]|uniref:Uncharacterized protein n=1 Tax=Macroventuria anomochaeta TaxID=301207 RepID=A0ACB6SEW2_9PLEO|nr:uncharacterized protein BU25DRAFT_454504 [Macroventuria anomochaeta]KAF2632140.1 hypothetical protein BU25DRAFT_454504 [Macroventuria anomochaeta]